jgi:hypothetical protein
MVLLITINPKREGENQKPKKEE